MLVVNPVARKKFSGRALALRYLVLVMRVDQINSSCMNVEGLAQIFHGHGGAFYVPARTASTKRRVPSGFVRRPCSFPQGEVARVFLVVLVCVNALACASYVA